ncbi:Arylsulfatase A-related enzyme [Rubrobacter radiotolerans]|nr:Arylsulfatase A-related enzyme [Rubrobacter radiotolerans]
MNVVVVLLDSLRKDHVGALGNSWIKTPNLDALAGESLSFTRAFPESIPTIPARRSIYTGTRTWPFRNWIPQKGETFFPAGWQRIPEEQVSVTELLSDEGFQTALITDTQHEFKASMNFQRGFDVFDFIRGQERDRWKAISSADEELVERFTIPGNDASMRDKVRQYVANTRWRRGEEDYFAPLVFRRSMEYLEVARESQPFFLVIDSFDPHEPWDPPKKYTDLYDDPDYSGREPTSPNYGASNYLSEREIERMRALYAGEVTMTDKWFGDFMNRLDSLALLDSTLVIVTSDHGVSLAEHGYTGKVSEAIWPELTDIPFFIRHPEGRGAGQESDFYASLHDIAPTVLSQVDLPVHEQMTGQDLSPLLDGDPPNEERPYFTLGYNDHSSARDDDYVLVCRSDGENPRLYDLREDPNMDRDIASGNEDVVRRMYDEYILRDAGGEPPPLY